MTEQTSVKTFSLEPALAERRSPRAFSATAVLTTEHLGSAFEAARWSPSSSNSQPWRFTVGFRGDEIFDSIASTLASGNHVWANRASALIANITRVETDEGKPLAYALYDLGQAVAHFSVQATADGLFVHQMGGFDSAALGQALGLDAKHRVISVMTVGVLGGPEDLQDLPETLQEREHALRVRKPLSMIVDGSARYA
jgi:nitroreductase